MDRVGICLNEESGFTVVDDLILLRLLVPNPKKGSSTHASTVLRPPFRPRRSRGNEMEVRGPGRQRDHLLGELDGGP